jgi:hypothetical protein
MGIWFFIIVRLFSCSYFAAGMERQKGKCQRRPAGSARALQGQLRRPTGQVRWQWQGRGITLRCQLQVLEHAKYVHACVSFDNTLAQSPSV